jgi:hypothetical protein
MPSHEIFQYKFFVSSMTTSLELFNMKLGFVNFTICGRQKSRDHQGISGARLINHKQFIVGSNPTRTQGFLKRGDGRISPPQMTQGGYPLDLIFCEFL